MSLAKIQLSPEELNLVQNPQWLLTKNIIIEKVYILFGELAAERSALLKDQSPFLAEEILLSSPKISRGEKYKELPYVMLDYPRIFSKEDIFAVRTFFWWGNYFSVTLHLKGKYQQQYMPIIQEKIQFLAKAGFRLSISGDEWEQDIESAEFIPLDKNNSHLTSKKLSEADFYRVSCPVAFSNWNEMKEILIGLNETIFNAIAG
ncbi:MAG: hypothetical protein ACKVOW_02270 [Chitinophagaceae bacterium]